MQAYMSPEALRLTGTTGKVHYWSRTRKRLWLKGEESGHFQILHSISLDCDRDALLIKVRQIGFCCHTGRRGCFDTAPVVAPEIVDWRLLGSIYEAIQQRIRNPSRRSYVSRVMAKGKGSVFEKIEKEASELATKSHRKGVVASKCAELLLDALVGLATTKVDTQIVFGKLRAHRI